MIDLMAAKDAAVAAVLPLRGKLMEGYGTLANTLKSDLSAVTEMDSWAETEIKKSLAKFDPSLGFLGEEHGAEGDTERRWIIDPIDGTEPYIRGLPFCSNMVCLVDGKDLLVSVIYNFVTDELYWAVKGEGAWRGEKRLSVSRKPLDRSFVEVGIRHESLRGQVIFTHFVKSVKSVHRYASVGFLLCAVARGSIEGKISYESKGGPWDYAPGALLITEAGGLVEHFGGKPYDYLDTSSYVAGTQAVIDLTRSIASRS